MTSTSWNASTRSPATTGSIPKALALSDESLMADLEKRHSERVGADTLVLETISDKKKKDKHKS
jgi:hypothetical protein